jgi:hypothetical protein
LRETKGNHYHVAEVNRMKTTLQKKGRATRAPLDTAQPKKSRGRPALQLSEEERAARLAQQNAAASRKMRERVHYASVPLEKDMFDWLEAERAKLRPIPGVGRLIVMHLEDIMLDTKAKRKRKA